MKKVCFVFKTKKASHFLNKAMRAHIPLYEVLISNSGVRLYVEAKDRSRIGEIAKEEGVKVEKAGRTKASIVKARPVLLIALVCVLIFVSFFESFIYRVEISGNHFVNSSDIHAVLAAHHADGFVAKQKVDLDAIQRDVTALPGISFASVGMKGGLLYVSVKEELLPQSFEEENTLSVLATRAGVITKIVAESGTPKVRVGDVVRAGDVLIKAEYTFTEGNAASPAKGEVWASTIYSKEYIYPQFSIQNVRTGETVSVRELSLFGRNLFSDREEKAVGMEVTERLLYSVGWLTVKENTYWERKDVTIYRDLDTEADVLIEKARESLLADIPFHAYGASVVTAEEKKMDNALYIVVYCTVVQRIDSLFLPNER